MKKVEKIALDAAYAKIASLIEEKSEMQKRISELEIYKKENENSNTEMALAYMKVCDERDKLKKEVSDLKTRKIFGSSSESIFCFFLFTG